MHAWRQLWQPCAAVTASLLSIPEPVLVRRSQTSCQQPQARPMPTVHLGPRFRACAEAFCKAGPGSLQVISDFDQTLTSFMGFDGAKADECHGLLLQRLDAAEVPGLQASHWQHLRELERRYHIGDWKGLETYQDSLGIPKDQLTSWWFNTYQAIAAHFRLWESVEACVARSNTRPREGLGSTFSWLECHGVPLLIVSAGLSQILHCILSKGGCPLPSHAALVANDLREPTSVMDHTKKVMGISLAPADYREAATRRKHVLVLGDKLSDLDLVEGLGQDCIVLSICFASDGLVERRGASSEAIDKLLVQYDAVLTGDASMRFVNDFLQGVASGAVQSIKLIA